MLPADHLVEPWTLEVNGLLFPNPNAYRKVDVVLLFFGLADGSLERLCLGGVAWEEGRVCSYRVRRLVRLQPLYGTTRSWGFRFLAESSLRSLHEYLERQPGATRSMAGWSAPHRDTHPVHMEARAMSDLESALRNKLTLHASLYFDERASA